MKDEQTPALFPIVDFSERPDDYLPFVISQEEIVRLLGLAFGQGFRLGATPAPKDLEKAMQMAFKMIFSAGPHPIQQTWEYKEVLDRIVASIFPRFDECPVQHIRGRVRMVPLLTTAT